MEWQRPRGSPSQPHGQGRVAFIGERLLQMRRQHGWSISQAARQLGVDRTTWEGWERGELILFRKHRTKVVTFLGLDPKELAVEMRTRWNGKHLKWERGKS